MTERRAFLFLQGPPGPLFRLLGQALASRGVAVHRINLSGGDELDWPDGAFSYRGSFSDWPVFIDRFLRDHGITDLMLFGDCRPYHVAAHGMARLRAIRTHVLEEGYIRPDWMTLELEGVNARSTLSRDKNWFIETAKGLPQWPEAPPITASFRRRARDGYWHYHHVVTGRLMRDFPHYRSHRPGSICIEGIGWTWKFLTGKRRRAVAESVLRTLSGKPYFLLPLQLSGDYQIRTHSPFPDMQSAALYAFNSFAAHAPADCHLLVKRHPLDCSFFDWHGFVRGHARRLGLKNRLHFVDGGDLDAMTREARGLVCVNSTTATLALAYGTPVCTLGKAIYNIEGLTHQEHLDSFWVHPTRPEAVVFEAFRSVLLDRCLVRGGLASRSGIEVLIESILEKLGWPAASRDPA